MIKKSKLFVYALVFFFCAQCGAQGTSMWLDDSDRTRALVGEYDSDLDADPWFDEAGPLDPDQPLEILLYECELFEQLAITAWDYGPITAMIMLRRSLDRGSWNFDDKQTALVQQRDAAHFVKGRDFSGVEAVRHAAREECRNPGPKKALTLPIHLDEGEW
jgi:hypothetical protein